MTDDLELMSLAETCSFVKKSRWWVRERVREGKFPKPIYLDDSRHGKWVLGEVKEYVRKIVEQRDQAAA